jgi:hypothetical protein
MLIPALKKNPQSKNYTSGLLAAGAGALLVAGVVTSPAMAAPGAADSTQIPICHLTGSQGNKYISVLTVKSSIVNSRQLYTNDVFPPFAYTDPQGQTQEVAGQNWDAAGQALYANGCVAPASTPTPTVTPTVTPTIVPTTVPTETTVPTSVPTATTVPTQTTEPTTAPTSASPVPSTPTSDPVVVEPTTPAPTTQQTLPPVVSDSPSSAPAPSTSVTSSTATTPASPSAGVSGTPVGGEQATVQPAAAGQAVAQGQGGDVSLRAQTAASAPAADSTASNAFYASGALMLLGALVPRFSKGRRGRHL